MRSYMKGRKFFIVFFLLVEHFTKSHTRVSISLEDEMPRATFSRGQPKCAHRSVHPGPRGCSGDHVGGGCRPDCFGVFGSRGIRHMRTIGLFVCTGRAGSRLPLPNGAKTWNAGVRGGIDTHCKHSHRNAQCPAPCALFLGSIPTAPSQCPVWEWSLKAPK